MSYGSPKRRPKDRAESGTPVRLWSKLPSAMPMPRVTTAHGLAPSGRVAPLLAFVDWYSKHVRGDEKGEAQIFLDRLLQAFGQKGCLEVGGTPEFRVRKAAEAGGGTSFADYVWKPIVLIEMKKRGQDLGKHYRQAFDYWARLVPGRPRYVVLCNFDEFWVYDFNRQMDVPVDTVKTADLPTRFGPLTFLFPGAERPVFGNDHEAVTREAASALAGLYHRLVDRGVDRESVQRFTLQSLVALFAEDIGLLPKYAFTRLVEDCAAGSNTYDVLGDLFTWMNTPSTAKGGRYKDVPYFNGGLFAVPARVELDSSEVTILRKACTYDWSKVRPEIFGTIFEGSLASDERHSFGAHFTSPVDIMKIVGPTVVEPWRAQIESARTISQLDRLLDRLTTYRVLDPACGSGNFLYIAYRELKRLEARIYERRASMLRSTRKKQQGHLRFVGVWQFHGLDINPFAVELAKVTLTIAHKLVIDELGLRENALPLDNLDGNFVVGDALVDEAGEKRAWPEADVIIGNPPFLGAKRLKPERGSDYINALRKLYPGVPGMADYCVYWLRRAHDHLMSCTPGDSVAGRAGLVGTQNVRNNMSRVGGLDHIVATGTIVEAVDNQPWSGDAAVHVSIVNWVKSQDPRVVPSRKRLWSGRADRRHGRANSESPQGKLGGEITVREVDRIGASLSDDAGAGSEEALGCNKEPKRCFQGKIPGYAGFMLTRQQAERMGADSGPVIVPYLTGRELLDEFRIERWAVDFGDRTMLEASVFGSAFKHCESLVLPKVQEAFEQAARKKSDMAEARKEHLARWWQFWNRRDELSRVLSVLPRYIGCSRVTRRPIMVFLSAKICPSDLVQVFAFSDDYSFGVLQSAFHFEWFRRKASRMKIESDLRYSVRDVFETFPWPQGPEFRGPGLREVGRVAEAARGVREMRAQALGSVKGGLRALYKTLELPGRSELKDAHAELDEAVRDAYGFSTSEAAEAGRSLASLNRAVARRLAEGKIVAAPGIPQFVTDAGDLTSSDCYAP